MAKEDDASLDGGLSLEELMDEIENREHSVHRLSDVLMSSSCLEDMGDALEDEIILKVDEKDALEDNLVVAGIDGGLIKKEYHGFGLVLTRAVCSVIEYEGGCVKSSYYVPSASPEPDIRIFKDISDTDMLDIRSSCVRVMSELSLACDVLDKGGVDMLLLDGSIVLHPSLDNPDMDGSKEVKRIVKKMHSLSLEKGIYLLGIIEDSRCSDISRKIIPGGSGFGNDGIIKDTEILSSCLEKGQRTSLFRKKTGHGYCDIYYFYIRNASNDAPLRVEFLSNDPGNDVDIISCAIYSMSKHNDLYGVPPVIIDADSRAKISNDEPLIGHIDDMATRKSFSSSMLRRQRRPF